MYYTYIHIDYTYATLHRGHRRGVAVTESSHREAARGDLQREAEARVRVHQRQRRLRYG